MEEEVRTRHPLSWRKRLDESQGEEKEVRMNRVLEPEEEEEEGKET